ncbi:MAG: GIY-YIG nuclease family protein [Patescibacteria group bacterium]|nr:GIY-YIG nuclease family protein [Patescibacteria group bacterium]
MYYIYILHSVNFGRYYVGFTSNLKKRLKYHNKGSNRSTRAYRPYELIYFEKFVFKTEALKRERQIKKFKGGKAFKLLLSSWDGGAVKRAGL